MMTESKMDSLSVAMAAISDLKRLFAGREVRASSSGEYMHYEIRLEADGVTVRACHRSADCGATESVVL